MSKVKAKATCTLVWTCHDQVELDVEYEEGADADEQLAAVQRALTAYEATHEWEIDDWEIDDIEVLS